MGQFTISSSITQEEEKSTHVSGYQVISIHQVVVTAAEGGAHLMSDFNDLPVVYSLDASTRLKTKVTSVVEHTSNFIV